MKLRYELNDENVKQLVDAIKLVDASKKIGNNKITSLVIRNTNLNAKYAMEILESLKTHELTKIEFNYNKLEEAVLPIVKYIKENFTGAPLALDLSNNNISDETAVEVFKIIEKSKVQGLKIGNNNISNRAVEKIVESLSGNNNIWAVGFENNKINQEGKELLYKLLETHPSIAFIDGIDLEEEMETNEALSANILKNQSKIQSIINNDNKQKEQESKEMKSSAVSASDEKENSNNPGSSAKSETKKEQNNDLEFTMLLKSMKNNDYQTSQGFFKDNLSEVSLKINKKLTFEEVSQLCEAIEATKEIGAVDFKNCGLDGENAVRIAESLKKHSVNMIDFEQNNIGNKAADVVKKLVENLSDEIGINFNKNNIDNDTAAEIVKSFGAGNKNYCINLENNSITNKGAIAIAKNIEHNSNIKKIFLKDNMISAEGKAALCDVAKTHDSIVDIDILSNDKDSELQRNLCKNSLAYLEKVLLKLQEFKNKLLDKEDAQRELKEIEDNLQKCKKNCEKQLQEIEDDMQKQIKQKLETASSVNENKTENVVELEKEEDFLDEKVFTNLLDNIKNSKYGFTNKSTNHAVAFRKEEDGDVCLYLKCNLSKNQVKELSKALKGTKEIHMVSIYNSNLSGEKAVEIAESLEKQPIKMFYYFNMSNTNHQEANIAKALGKNFSNKEGIMLKFSGNNIKDTDAVQIFEALESKNNVKSVILEKNPITDQAAIAIAQSLKNNSNIMHFNLNETSITHEGQKALLKVVETHPSLVSIEIIDIGEALEQNSTLKTNLEKNLKTAEENLYQISSPQAEKVVDLSNQK